MLTTARQLQERKRRIEALHQELGQRENGEVKWEVLPCGFLVLSVMTKEEEEEEDEEEEEEAEEEEEEEEEEEDDDDDYAEMASWTKKQSLDVKMQ